MDPSEAAHYVNAASEDSEAMFLVALRDVAEARQMARVANQAGVAREALYRMLCDEGNPRLHSLWAILNAVGLRISVEQSRDANAQSPRARVARRTKPS